MLGAVNPMFPYSRSPHLILIFILHQRRKMLCRDQSSCLSTLHKVSFQISWNNRKNMKMSTHFHFSRLTSHFNSRAPVGYFMNGWVWTAAPDAVFPHFGINGQKRGGGKGSHLEVGPVPQQVLRTLTPSMLTLNSGNLGPVGLYGILLGSAAGQGPPGFKHGPCLHYIA